MTQAHAIWLDPIDFVGADVSWAGPHPHEAGYCFGFDDGTLRFRADSDLVLSEPIAACPSGEAVNGVAFAGPSSIAVSTRADIAFIERQTSRTRAVYPAGSHGVVASPSGCFVAPLGVRGYLTTKAGIVEARPIVVENATNGQLYFGRMTIVHENSVEALVFAHRRNGVGVREFRGMGVTQPYRTLASAHFDAIDVCSVSANHLGVIALAPTADMIVFDNVLDPFARQIPLRLEGVEGRPHRVLCVNGHLVMLTSRGVHVWFDFVESALQKRSELHLPLVVLPLDAIDVNAIDDGRVALVMGANQVQVLDLVVLRKSVAADLSRPSVSSERLTESSREDWETSDIELSDAAFA